MNNMGEQVSAMDRGKVEAQINSLKQAMPGEDSECIRTQIAALQQVMMGIGQATYSSSAAATESEGNGRAEPRDDGIAEGEYHEI